MNVDTIRALVSEKPETPLLGATQHRLMRLLTLADRCQDHTLAEDIRG